MDRRLRLGMFALSATLLAAALDAQEAGDAKARKPRTVSPKMTEAIRERVPKFDPTVRTGTARPPAGAAAAESDDLLVLPKMTVNGLALPPEAVRLSENARIARAMKSHPGLRLGNFGATAGISALLEREETLAAHKAETSAIIDGATLDAVTPDARKIRELLGAALQQSNQDWQHGRGGTPSLHDAVPPPPTADRKRDRRRE